MKLIYAQGFSKSEKLEWKPVVFNNVVQSFRLIFEAMRELNVAFEKPENNVRKKKTSTQHTPFSQASLLIQSCVKTVAAD